MADDRADLLAELMRTSKALAELSADAKARADADRESLRRKDETIRHFEAAVAETRRRWAQSRASLRRLLREARAAAERVRAEAVRAEEARTYAEGLYEDLATILAKGHQRVPPVLEGTDAETTPQGRVWWHEYRARQQAQSRLWDAEAEIADLRKALERSDEALAACRAEAGGKIAALEEALKAERAARQAAEAEARRQRLATEELLARVTALTGEGALSAQEAASLREQVETYKRACERLTRLLNPPPEAPPESGEARLKADVAAMCDRGLQWAHDQLAAMAEAEPDAAATGDAERRAR